VGRTAAFALPAQAKLKLDTLDRRMAGTTSFKKLNAGWNAEPNAPEPLVRASGTDLVLEFGLNPWQFPQFSRGQRGHIRFRRAWRYRLGMVNDEGWYRGQCRFSSLAPAWGEFYEVSGDLKLTEAPNDWVYVAPGPNEGARHFLFYFRDEEFECDAADWEFHP
jgi:hypothetical protein